MLGTIRSALLAAALATGGAALAQDTPAAQPAPAAAATAPTDLVPSLPDPNETNAQRAKSQPGNNAPFWRGVRDSATVPTVTNLPGREGEGGTLVQEFVQYPGSTFTTAGEAWRQVRNQWILPYGGWLLLAVIALIALFYWRFGMLGHAPNAGAKTIERFTAFERAAHWTNAIAFVVLAVSGVVMAFGKFVLLPIVGGTLFGWLTYALKTLHNFVGPVFAVSLAVVFLTFVRDNIPRRQDLTWLAKGGGMLSGREVPSHRFNAGEKLIFWGGVFALGIVVVLSGLVLDKLLPGLLYTRGQMQVAHMVHAVATVLMVAMFLGHIYIGTLGMRGAYSAMRHGRVDESWAKEHHELWYDDIKAGRIPAERSPRAATAPQPKTV
jgi:formate dehydrogenase subunit gamma